MRDLVDRARLDRFMRSMGRAADRPGRAYLSQALAKIERGHARDTGDVAAMIERDLVERARLRELFDAIEPSLYRFPAIDPVLFRRSVLAVSGSV